MPLIACDGSWQRWHAAVFRIGTTVRSTVPPLASITRVDAALLRWKAVARLAGRRRHLQAAARAQGTAHVLRRAQPIDDEHPLDVGLPAEALHHAAR